MGSVLQGQKTGDEYILYLHDENGNTYGFLLKNGTTQEYYYYIFNAQGDVIGILNANGTKVVEYTYSAWGEVLSITGTLVSTIGQTNPIRYRGYYYDNETGFYYLQLRYYDPTTQRFINSDKYVSTGQGILGDNMFAYCGNNPVVFKDSNGEFWVLALVTVVAAAVITATAVATVKETKRVNQEISQLKEPQIDITERLDKEMRENAQYLVDYQKKHGFIATELEFVNKVKSGGDWDFKQKIDKSKTYKYRDKTLEAQDIGNIHYGYVGASMGFTEPVLLKMAGLVQTKRTWMMFFASNGDDMRDQMYIKYGIKLYFEDKK